MTGLVGTLLGIAAAIALILVCVSMVCVLVLLVLHVRDTVREYKEDWRRDRKWKP